MPSGTRSGTDIRDGHIGLAVTIIALIVIAIASGPKVPFIVAGCFTAWFILVLSVVHILGGRGREAVKRAYVATFWWGDYLTP
ncbi:hypothetical protein [Streptomyces griseosporeus]|uniref:hypothetical protein n=1 Tax=Streptomyces griseosporeus TaxID=1910 RepID=UPI0036BA0E47